MILEIRAAPPFFKNGFVVGCEDTREAVVIDPGDEVGDLLAAVDHHACVRYILLTHAHIDHITGVGAAKKALGVPVGLHKGDLFSLQAIAQQGQMLGVPADPQPDIDFFYDGPGPWRFGTYGAWVHHTPGHCPGGVCLAIGREEDADGRSSLATRSSPARSVASICLAAISRHC